MENVICSMCHQEIPTKKIEKWRWAIFRAGAAGDFITQDHYTQEEITVRFPRVQKERIHLSKIITDM